MASAESLPRISRKGAGGLLARASISILCAVLALTLFLIAFRIVHFKSSKYELRVVGFHAGRALGSLILPALGIQAFGILAGALAWRRGLAAQWGAFGGAVALLSLICVLWVNLAEMFVGDLAPAVHSRIAQISESLRNRIESNPAAWKSLAEFTGDIDFPGPRADPYAFGKSMFQIEVSPAGFTVLSIGPDGARNLPPANALPSNLGALELEMARSLYDPTNGVWSRGDIIVWSPAVARQD